ncbi:MAG: cytochrome D ubiquinol oxidase subunit II [Deltaproteobacteria bacterium]|nr:MAG: cytochrome D ubiquinol oxidase subunit II [Deltaproteobacteria bacterium]
MRGRQARLAGYKVSPEELLAELRETVEGLAEDGADRGDLKILARAMRELRHSFRIFAGLRGFRKVTVFGSARCRPDSPGYRQAVAFGGEMARRGWLVITGGGEGIMEAAHVGAGQELAMGINILLPFEQPDNPVIAGDSKLIHVKYFFTRKLLFVKESDGVALFPGGFGTLDESFEVLTLLQTGKSRLFPIVLVDEPGGDYWRLWKEFVERHLLGRGWISREDLAFFRIADDAAQAAEEILGFYRAYHSMRYVGKDLVFRLRLPLADALLPRIQAEFGGILESGGFRMGGALPEEADEPELAGLPRLIFRFNRKSFGSLRMLVDFLNREAA